MLHAVRRHAFGLLLLLALVALPAPPSLSRGTARGPAFQFRAAPIPAELAQRMTGVSWRAGCPVPISDLVLVNLSHWGFDGQVKSGQLVVHRDVRRDVETIFRQLFLKRFPIEKMRLIEDYGGSDDRSVADNNSSSFNCRRKTGKSEFSYHSYGRAVDLNPLRNPYVKGATVIPTAGQAFLDRSRDLPGMIRKGDVVYRAFRKQGWRWGGDWRRVKDYQHFEKR